MGMASGARAMRLVTAAAVAPGLGRVTDSRLPGHGHPSPTSIQETGTLGNCEKTKAAKQTAALLCTECHGVRQ